MKNENRITEYKESVTNSFLKTVSAFSNYNTGIIIFGVDDDGNVVGISDLKQASLDIENKINDSITPKPNFTITCNYENNTITLIVYEGNFKPYLYKGKAYKRNDTSTTEMDLIEMKRFILRSSNITFDLLDAEVQNLNFNYLSYKFDEVVHLKITEEALITLNLMNSEKVYNNAGLLLSDNNIFPGIDIVEFKDSINIIKDRNRFSNKSILELYYETTNLLIKKFSFEEIQGLERVEKNLIPQEAIREAIANALLHREWDINAFIKISIWEDRIEITSPGGLPYGMNEEMYLKGSVSIIRNPIISNVFFRLKIVEQFGTGITRIEKCYENSMAKPIFDLNESFITIKLPILQEKLNLSDDETKIFNVINNNRKSSSMIMELTGFKKTKTLNIIRKLLEKGLIKSEGEGPATKYYK